jgi:hypothetical protein
LEHIKPKGNPFQMGLNRYFDALNGSMENSWWKQMIHRGRQRICTELLFSDNKIDISLLDISPSRFYGTLAPVGGTHNNERTRTRISSTCFTDAP